MSEDTKIDYDKQEKISLDSLRKLIEGIENNELTDSNKVEFFDVYEDEIIQMIENKIKETKRIFSKLRESQK